MIPYGRQCISDDDVESVVEILRSDWLTQGPTVPAFEDDLAELAGASHAVAVNSATSALHLACLALRLGAGDWLWTTPITFGASANCALYCGAAVDFVDIDPRTRNISVTALEEKLHRAKIAGKLPRIVVPVHFAGQSCEMQAIHRLAGEYGFKIVEDASHAVGGAYMGRAIGGCQFSDATVFSFHPVKIVTTGEGGAVLTRDPELAGRVSLLRSHGITRDPAAMEGPSEGAWYYQQVELGFNYRMTDIQAALGRSQLRRLAEFVARRRQIARRYDELLAELPLILPWQHPDATSAWHLYIVEIDTERCPRSRKEVFDALREAGIGVNVHYIPVHRQPYYRRMECVRSLPAAERYYARAISLPMYAALSDSDQSRVVQALESALR